MCVGTKRKICVDRCEDDMRLPPSVTGSAIASVSTAYRGASCLSPGDRIGRCEKDATLSLLCASNSSARRAICTTSLLLSTSGSIIRSVSTAGSTAYYQSVPGFAYRARRHVPGCPSLPRTTVAYDRLLYQCW
eukprot:1810526-Rhodomonas_salina.5